MAFFSLITRIMGSFWLIPIATVLSVLALNYFLHKDEFRDIANTDDLPHSEFTVVLQPKNSSTFLSLLLAEYQQFMDLGVPYQLMMKSPKGTRVLNHEVTINYRIVKNDDGKQTIEVNRISPDKQTTSTYEVQGKTIIPKASVLQRQNQWFGYLPFAIAIAIMIFGVGRFFQHALRNQGV